VLLKTCTDCTAIDSRTVSREIGLIVRQTIKGNLRRRTCHESPALVSSLTSALDGRAIPRDREPHYPLCRRLGGLQAGLDVCGNFCFRRD